MKTRLTLNPCVSFKKKENTYAFYINFNFYFFDEVAADLMDKTISMMAGHRDASGIPDDFLSYLIEKKIVLEVKNEKVQ